MMPMIPGCDPLRFYSNDISNIDSEEWQIQAIHMLVPVCSKSTRNVLTGILIIHPVEASNPLSKINKTNMPQDPINSNNLRTH
jgi:hypothetical protein